MKIFSEAPDYCAYVLRCWVEHPQDKRYCCSGVGSTMTIADEEKGLVMRCIRCDSEWTRKDGPTRLGGQRWCCHARGRCFTARSTSAFSHRGFPMMSLPD